MYAPLFENCCSRGSCSPISLHITVLTSLTKYNYIIWVILCVPVFAACREAGDVGASNFHHYESLSNTGTEILFCTFCTLVELRSFPLILCPDRMCVSSIVTVILHDHFHIIFCYRVIPGFLAKHN